MKDVLNHFGIEIPNMKRGEKLQPKKQNNLDSPKGPEIKVPKKSTENRVEPEIEKAPNDLLNENNKKKVETNTNDKTNKKSEL